MGGRIGSEGWEDLHSPNENIAIYWDWSWCIKLYLIHWVYLSLSSVSKQKHVMAVGPEDVLSLPSGLTGSLCTSRENSLWNWKDPGRCWKKKKMDCHWALQSKGLIWIWLLIFNTAVSWAGGEAVMWLFQHVQCVCVKRQYCCAKKESSTFAHAAVSGLTPIRTIDGSNISAYTPISLFLL